MKTNNLTKRSLLTTLILALSAGLGSAKGGPMPSHNSPNGFIGGGSPYYTPKHTKFKGYMREARRTDRGHGYNKHRIHALH